MHNSFLIFDFGTNEEAAQQARQKLERWKQAFRLDKKLLYKFEREEPTADKAVASESHEAEGKPVAKAAKSKPTKKSAKPKSGKNAKEEDDAEDAEPTGNTKLLVRLYFSGHEKLTYQRWIDRLPTEEPFKAASPEIIHQGDAAFDQANNRFENLA